MQAFQATFGLLLQFAGLLTELGEAEGAGAACQAVQLVAQKQQQALALGFVRLQQLPGLLPELRQFLAQAFTELLTQLLQMLLQGVGDFIHGGRPRFVAPGWRAAWGRTV